MIVWTIPIPAAQATEPESTPVGLHEYSGSEEPFGHTADNPPRAIPQTAQPAAGPSQPQPAAPAAMPMPHTLVASLGPQADSGTGGGMLPATEQGPLRQTCPTGGSGEAAGAAAGGSAGPAGGTKDLEQVEKLLFEV